MKTLIILVIVSISALLTSCTTMMPSWFQEDYFVHPSVRGTNIVLQIVNAKQHQLQDVRINNRSLTEFYRGDWSVVQLGWGLIRESAYQYRGKTTKGYPKLKVGLQIIGYFYTPEGIKMYLPRGARPGQAIWAEEESPLLIIFDEKSIELGPPTTEKKK